MPFCRVPAAAFDGGMLPRTSENDPTTQVGKERLAPVRCGRGSGGFAETLVAEVVRWLTNCFIQQRD